MRNATPASGGLGLGTGLRKRIGRLARTLAIATLALAAPVMTAGHARAASTGDLDTSFDLDGITLTKLSDAVAGEGDAIAIQSDGKIVVAGSTGSSPTFAFAVARYNADGSLDSSFGTGGRVTTAFGYSVEVRSVAVQSDGKIVVAGSTDGDFTVVRYNADGSLDSSFGTGGKVTTTVGSYDRAMSVAIQSDGKIVVAGSTGSYPTTAFAVARYNADGSLDSSFGSGGKVTTAIGSGEDIAMSVAIDSDGKIVAAGYAGSVDGPGAIALVRYNADGSLDSSFGTVGTVTTAFGATDPGATSVVIQGDGKIVAAGCSGFGEWFGQDVTVARYNADGSLDSSFGSSGKATTSIGSYDCGRSVAIDSGGKIVVAADDGYQPDKVLRYNTDGTLDSGFGDGGAAPMPLGDDTELRFVAIQADGRIVTGGEWDYEDKTFAVARFNDDGTVDESFDGDGSTPSYTSQDYASAMAAQSDGKIVTVGWSEDPLGINDFAVVRYNPDGSRDASFGFDGKTTVAVDPAASDEATSVALQSDGKILVAGTVDSGGSYDFALVRLNADGTLDDGFDGDGKSIQGIGSGDDVAYSVALWSDKIVLAGSSWNGSDGDFAVMRFNAADGSLDTSFSGDGKVTTGFGATSDDGVESVAVQNDGKVVVAGFTGSGSAYDIAVARYNIDGSLDTTFGSGGKVTTSIGANQDFGRALVIQADGHIVVAGNAWTTLANSDFAVVRYNSSGGLDTSFGGGTGKVTTGLGTYDIATSVAIEGDGRIVVAGQSWSSADADFAVVRYQANGALDTSFDGDGKVTSDLAGGTEDDATAVAVQWDGKILVAGSSADPDGSSSFAVARYFVTDCGDGTVVPGELCDDGNNVSGDDCDAGCQWETSCPMEPLPVTSCLVGAKLQLQARHSVDPNKRQLSWKWGAGEALSQPDLGSPDVDTTHTLCVYDTIATVPTLVTWLDVAAGPAWITKAPKGWNYTDKLVASDGVQKLQLKTGDPGKSRVQLKARGNNLRAPAPISGSEYLDQDPSVIVQLLSSEGLCLTSEFPVTSMQKNDGAQFKAVVK